MTKYRILKQTYENGKELFFIQYKFLNLFWIQKWIIVGILEEKVVFESLQEAKRWIKDKSTLIEVKKGWNLKKEEIINP